LLGFGLSYYRDKLKEAIFGEIQKVEAKKDYSSYDNLILKSDELTTLKLVKLQAEPLLTLLRCLDDVNCNVSDALTDISTKFSQVNVEEFAQLPKYLITFFFMVGSIDDNELTKHYLEKTIAIKEYASLRNTRCW
jgi:hypothetical protein